jgi:hypothetical protein
MTSRVDRHLVDDGRLTETRTARAKILVVSSPGPKVNTQRR